MVGEAGCSVVIAVLLQSASPELNRDALNFQPSKEMNTQVLSFFRRYISEANGKYLNCQSQEQEHICLVVIAKKGAGSKAVQ